MSYKHHYGPPKRTAPKPYSSSLECLENYKNRLVANEYLPTIARHLKDLEQQSEVNPAMIDLQPEVKWFMRPYLVNFIVQMHSSLKLKPQTLFLCWNIIDRYCAKRIAFKQHYQLIGCTALWIASKYEDKKSRVPSISELSMMCSNVYEESMFREMEVHILSTLGWSVGHASLEELLQLCVKYSDPDGKESLSRPIEEYKGNSQTVSAILAVSRYLCELSLYERDYLTFKPSLVGTTAFLLSCSMLGLDTGSKFLNSIYHEYRLDKSHATPGRRPVLHQTPARQSGRPGQSASQQQLPTPITPKKEYQFFDDECMYDSDAENKDPADEHMYGPFLSGFEGCDSINQVRQISILLLKSLLNPSDVLVEKYLPLGVISVVKNFIAENHLKDLDMDEISTIDCQSVHVSDFVFDLSNLLLNFDSNLEFVTEQAMHLISSVYQSPMAAKGRSASASAASTGNGSNNHNNSKGGSTSSASSSSPSKAGGNYYSPFNSPSNFSSFSSASSQTTYDSCYEEVPGVKSFTANAPVDENVRPQQSRMAFPNSSPLMN